jgi:hypothetical protein
MFAINDTAIRVIGVALAVAALFGFGYYKGHSSVQAKFDQYKAEINAAAELQAKETAKVEAKNKQLFEETKYAYDTKLTALRNYYSMRIAQSGGSLSGLPSATTGIIGYTVDNLPPVTTLAAQCAETTLTLYTLQNWVKDTGAINP